MKKERFLSDALHSGLSEKSDFKEIKWYFNRIYFSLLLLKFSAVLRSVFKLYRYLNIWLDCLWK